MSSSTIVRKLLWLRLILVVIAYRDRYDRMEERVPACLSVTHTPTDLLVLSPQSVLS